jgi:hypothetical protein
MQVNGGTCGGFVAYTACGGSYQSYYLGAYQSQNVCVVGGYVNTFGGCTYSINYGFTCVS